jgi:GDP-fucose protein O-fucosyltransferase
MPPAGAVTLTPTAVVRPRKAKGRVELAAYFFTVLTVFAVSNFVLNLRTAAGAGGIVAGGSSDNGSGTQNANNVAAQMLQLYLQPSQSGQQSPPNSKEKGGSAGKAAMEGAGASKHKQNSKDTASELSSGTQKLSSSESYSLAGLSCDAWGGPAKGAAEEMVYWEDIPKDNQHTSPLKNLERKQYLTFEPDHGGFNNIRMAFETTLALAVAMGRTLVLPPEQRMYLLTKKTHEKHGKDQRATFSFQHFFHMEAIHNEHVGVEIITMQEFLEREALTGNIVDVESGQVAFPPENRTDWNDKTPPLFAWLRKTFRSVVWIPEECLAVFPANKDDTSVDALIRINGTVMNANPPIQFESFVGKPVPVDANAEERLKENLAGRHNLCIYDRDLQEHTVLHFPVGRGHGVEESSKKKEARLLVHFYAMLFFQDWRQDLWMKRFVRDHVRFVDEIQCAAARVVHQIRERVRERTGDPAGTFDTMHVRRGDFQYKLTRVTADEIYQQTSKKLPENGTVFIATDERDKSFFEPLRAHYDVLFLDDFHDALGAQLNSNYFGTSKQIFYSCPFSRFFSPCSPRYRC